MTPVREQREWAEPTDLDNCPHWFNHLRRFELFLYVEARASYEVMNEPVKLPAWQSSRKSQSLLWDGYSSVCHMTSVCFSLLLLYPALTSGGGPGWTESMTSWLGTLAEETGQEPSVWGPGAQFHGCACWVLGVWLHHSLCGRLYLIAMMACSRFWGRFYPFPGGQGFPDGNHRMPHNPLLFSFRCYMVLQIVPFWNSSQLSRVSGPLVFCLTLTDI